MTVYATLKTENVGNILFTGSMEKCKEYCKKLQPANYHEISITDDNGTIRKWVVMCSQPAENYFEIFS